MPKKQKNLKVKVFFNASVIIAGLISPKGGSAKLLSRVKRGKLDAVISEIIIDEVLRHALKIKIKRYILQKRINATFSNISESPDEKSVRKFGKIVTDLGDAHVLASCNELGVDYLVTLDKKHILVLKEKIRKYKIVTPGELLQILK